MMREGLQQKANTYRSKTDLAYLAGIVDGEGSIDCPFDGRNKQLIYPRLVVTGTSEHLAEWLTSKFGGNVNWRPRAKTNWKQEFMWRLTHSRCTTLVGMILPYLVLKRVQANLVIALDTIKQLARERGELVSLGYRKAYTYGPETIDAMGFIREAMSRFNQRGVSKQDPWDFILEHVPPQYRKTGRR